jgi:hypothetical protein
LQDVGESGARVPTQAATRRKKKMKGSVVCERTFHLSRNRPEPALAIAFATKAGELLNRYAIFSFWLSSLSLSSWLFSCLLSSSPLVVTSFWLTEILSISFCATTHVHTKKLHEQITEKNKKSSYIFLSSKTLRILDKIFCGQHFTEPRICSTITLRRRKSE